MPNFGKPGTVTEAEFTALSDAVGTWGALLIALKIAKFCSNRAATLSHEYASSALATAYTGYASKITSVVRVPNGKISSEFFTTLGNMVSTYGPEVVVWKLAKIAGRNGASADKTLLAGLFPKSGSGSAPMGAVRPGAAAGGRRLGY